MERVNTAPSPGISKTQNGVEVHKPASDSTSNEMNAAQNILGNTKSGTLQPYIYARLEANQTRLFFPDYSRPPEDGFFGALHLVNIASHKTSSSEESLPEEQIAEVSHSYEALCYAWGNQSQTFPLICDGKELKIHANLRDALISLRQAGVYGPLWIDALCINQRDEHEKLVQIQLMCNIYRQATRIWTWLGNAVEGTKELISLMPQIISRRNDIWTGGADEILVKPELLHLPPGKSPVWEALCTIVSSPWFDRLWILQEAAFAAYINFLCWPYVISWKLLWHIMDMGKCLNLLDLDQNTVNIGQMGDARLSRINKIVFEVRRSIQETPIETRYEQQFRNTWILDVVRMSANQRCSESRDRILGLLGFLSEQDRASLQIRPGSSIQELSLAFCKFLLQKHPSNAFCFIASIIPPQERDSSLPSWCPNFANIVGLILPLESSVSYAASSKRQKAKEMPIISEVVLTGYRIDKVAAVMQGSWRYLGTIARMGSWIDLWETLSANLDWEQSCLRLLRMRLGLDKDSSTSNELPTDVPDQHYLTLILGQSEMHGRFVKRDDYLCIIRFMRSIAQLKPLFQSNLGKHLITKLPRPSSQYFNDFASNRGVGSRLSFNRSYKTFLEGGKPDDFSTLADDEVLGPPICNVQKNIEDVMGDASTRGLVEEFVFDDLEACLRELVDAYTAVVMAAWHYIGSLDKNSGQAYFVTEGGRTGLSRADIQAGDEICVFGGSAFPDVLRPETVDGKFKFLGHAYVHGIMNGEADTLGLPTEDITLV